MLQPLTEDPPLHVRRPAFRQDWLDLTMLHWEADPDAIARLLPAGTRPDLFEGRAYVGLIPFVMSGVRVLGAPPIPWLSRFPETNVRLYATDAQGRRGVVFRSLEASRLLPVLVARAAYALPYCWARMSVRHDDGVTTYTSARRWPGPRGAGGHVSVRPGERYDADPLSLFLTARWGLFSRLPGGRTAWAPVSHGPWPLHRAELVSLSDDLVPVGGLPPVSSRLDWGDPHVLWSPGVSVRFAPPQLLPR